MHLVICTYYNNESLTLGTRMCNIVFKYFICKNVESKIEIGF